MAATLRAEEASMDDVGSSMKSTAGCDTNSIAMFTCMKSINTTRRRR
jgi:hypothetical protein